jgi:hypothetical protein
MASYCAINRITLIDRVILPGDTVSDGIDPIAKIQAQGGILYPLPNATRAPAARVVPGRVRRHAGCHDVGHVERGERGPGGGGSRAIDGRHGERDRQRQPGDAQRVDDRRMG